jgi:hypothetical protein
MEGWFVFGHSVLDFREGEEKTNEFSGFVFPAGTTAGCVSSSATCLLGETD